jgi:hypothetical protein
MHDTRVRVALLTPQGRGALAVVGIAGAGAIETLSRLFHAGGGAPLAGGLHLQHSELDHVEVRLGRAAQGADPVGGDVGPAGAGGQALGRVAGFLVVDVAAGALAPLLSFKTFDFETNCETTICFYSFSKKAKK